MLEAGRRALMFSKQAISMLHSEMHRRVDDLLTHAERLRPGAFENEVAGFGRTSVRDQLVHVLATERAWVSALQGQPMPEWDYKQYKDVGSVRAAKQKVMLETRRYLDQISDADLNTTLQSEPPDWMGPLQTPAFILCHIITHAFHHKGQVVAMFRLAGNPIGDTDLQREDAA
jgi:uncharacterized damage-inducible protein DinB